MSQYRRSNTLNDLTKRNRVTTLSEARSRDTGGAGLGLAVVKALVTELGGRITVEDSPLGGARFTVILPVTP